MAEAILARTSVGSAGITLTKIEDISPFSFLNSNYKEFDCPKELAEAGKTTGFIVLTDTYNVNILVFPEKQSVIQAKELTGTNVFYNYMSSTTTTTSAWVWNVYDGQSTNNLGTPQKAWSYTIN